MVTRFNISPGQLVMGFVKLEKQILKEINN
jgi:hypothetical protein